MRVAIVGGGPRGIFAVERLWAHRAAVEVTVFDPQPPGVGAAYDPGQPDHLRLNVTSAVVSAGWPGEVEPPSFDRWRADGGEREPLEPFPPRARVGEYLAWMWQWLLARTPDGAILRHRPARVADVRPIGDGWLVDGERFDEVLLATGHELDWPGRLPVGGVFPVDRWLGEDRIPPGARVAVRGAALTFIDAALCLTEGRGGGFDGDWATGMFYRASGREPAVIWPVSRSGRWMDPKPQPGTPSATPREAVMDAGRRAIADADTPIEALAVVSEAALALGADQGEIDALLGPLAGDATSLLRGRLSAVAEGAGGTSWALGHAWRGLYDALRARFEGVGEGFAPFADLAARLERVAFGPPPVNAAKLLALIDSGIVDPQSLATARMDGSVPRGLPGEPDVVVDAVLAPPGIVPGSLMDRLLEAGTVVRPEGRRGVAVGPDASCLDHEGRPVRGLSCIGRATEDVVIGNDTLNRALHPAVDGWAGRIAERTLQR